MKDSGWLLGWTFTYVFCFAHRVDNGFDEGRGQAALGVEKGGICVLVEIELRYVAIPVWSALAGPEISGTNAASFQLAGRSFLGDTLPERMSIV
jgi:hypothetical protein